MIQIPFLSVPIAALCCFAILILALLAAKKNKLINSFIYLLICFGLWTGGSMLMRMQIFPGHEFWYEVSLLSLFAIPYALYNFVYDFVEAKGYLFKIIWFAETVVIMILTHFEVFLKPPVFVDQGNGRGVFLYSTEWKIAIPTVLLCIIILSAVLMMLKAARRKESAGAWIAPIGYGMISLLAGNLLSIIPGNIFPFDTLSGIVNAGCFLYALYKKRVFKLTLLVSRGTILVVSVIFTSIGFAFGINQLEEMLVRFIPQLSAYSTLLVAILFAVIALILYKILYRVLDNIFVKDEQIQARLIKDFSLKISKSLNLDEILYEFVSVIKKGIGVDKVYICLYDEKKACYSTAYSASPLDARSFCLSKSNPCIEWFKSHDSCIQLHEFQKTALYKSMWEQEKNQLSELQIQCIVPLKYDDKLIGVLLLPSKPKGRYVFDDMTFLESSESIVSIAINNASLYQKAYLEARVDPLTNLLNRKSFYEKLNDEFAAAKDHSIALVILNLDDFKLYNQLYGNHEGDLALQRAAAIISTCVGSSGVAARYGGKEFALILPFFDMMKALNLAEDIKAQIMNMNRGTSGDSMKVITLSSGICVYPYAAANAEQLISNADMAVYSAKRSGKNKIVVYSLGKPLASKASGKTEAKSGKYAEYASTIYALTAAIDAKDHYTFNHSQDVAEYAAVLAREIGLNEDHTKIIYEAGLLHDIGKIGIPESILTKPGRLTEEEYGTMQKHVENSIAMIRHLPSLDYIIPAVIGHHERWDGKGYPRKIKGEDIPLGARCLAIADAFDAMTTARPYKKPLPIEFAVNEIENNAGTQFDPNLVVVFVKLVCEGKIRVHDYPIQGAENAAEGIRAADD